MQYTSNVHGILKTYININIPLHVSKVIIQTAHLNIDSFKKQTSQARDHQKY